MARIFSGCHADKRKRAERPPSSIIERRRRADRAGISVLTDENFPRSPETRLKHAPLMCLFSSPPSNTVPSSMKSVPRWVTLSASILGFIAVALGAFGAHALKETLTERATLTTWQTAVLYQLVHSVALLVVAGWSDHTGKILWAARCWTMGVILFSGSLYWLALGGPKILGPITPLGGLAFLFGWLCIGWNTIQSPKA